MTPPLTLAEIQELERLDRAATAEPWEAIVENDPRGQPQPMYRGLVATVEHGDRYLAVVQKHGNTVEHASWEANTRLIASLRNSARKLIEAARRAERYEAALRRLINFCDELLRMRAIETPVVFKSAVDEARSALKEQP